MRSIEAEGEDIDQAIANALRALQVERDQIEVEILNAATRGVLGFGGRKARIRATVRPPLRALSQDQDGQPPPTIGAVARETGRVTGAADVPRERAERFLTDLFHQLGTTCRVHAEEDGKDAVLLTVSGPETALIIGRRGQTLDAIEYVLNRVVSRDEDVRGIPRFVVDAEGYRARRREYLEELAARLCSKVERTGRPVTLNPMTPRDRRTVHLAVQKHPGLTSQSFGEGHLRSMTILPEARAGRPGRGSGSAAD